jgi:hypothetical protein
MITEQSSHEKKPLRISRCVNCDRTASEHDAGKCRGSAGKVGKTFQTMDLPTGKTCNNCCFVTHCVNLYAKKPEDTGCDFFPVRFIERPL